MALKININAGQTCTYHSDSAHGRMPTKSPFKKACTNRRLIHLAINRPIFKSHSSITSKVQAGCKGKLRGNYCRVGQNLTIKHRTCTLVKSRHIPFITSRTTAKPSKVSGAHDDDVVSMALMVMSRILITTLQPSQAGALSVEAKLVTTPIYQYPGILSLILWLLVVVGIIAGWGIFTLDTGLPSCQYTIHHQFKGCSTTTSHLCLLHYAPVIHNSQTSIYSILCIKIFFLIYQFDEMAGKFFKCLYTICYNGFTQLLW